MSARGGVKTFRPTWVERDSEGNKVTRTSTRYAWRFWFKGLRYSQAGYDTAREALEAGEKRKSELRAGLEEDWRRYTLAGLKDLSDAHQETNEAATQRNHANSWDRMLKFWPPGMLVWQIDDVQLYRYLKHRRSLGMSDNSTKLDFAWLRKAMRLAHEKGMLPKVPKFPGLQYQRREQTFLPGELERVLSHMTTGYRFLFRAAEECGWRARSELTTRKWTDVDLGPERWTCDCGPITADGCVRCGLGRPGKLHVDAKSTKARKARWFPITRVLRGILDEARAHVDVLQQKHGRIIPYVFVRESGEPIRSYRDAWAQALKAAGFDRLPGKRGAWSSARVPHDLRRGALRRWERVNRLPEAARLDLAGHADARTHGLYLEQGPDEDALLAAARALDQQRHQEEPVSNVVQLELFRAKG